MVIVKIKNIKIKVNNFVKHPIIAGSAVLVVGSMAANVVNLIYQVGMGKILEPADYGILLSLYSILYILSIVPTSSSVSIVKFISSAKNEKERSGIYHSVKKLVFRVATVGTLFVVLFSPFIAKFLNINDVFSVVLTAGVFFFLLTTLVNQSSLQGILKFMGVVLPNFVSAFAKLILGVIFIFLGLSVRGAMLAVVIGAGFAYLLSVKMIDGHFQKESKTNLNLDKFIKYSGPVLLQAFAFTSLFTLDVILVKHFFSPYEAGIYATVSTLGKIVYFAAAPVASVMFPHISSRYAKGEKYYELLFGSIGLTFLISLVVVGCYFLFPNLIINILYRSKYIAAAPLLFLMGLFIAFLTMSNLLVNFFLSIDLPRVVILPFIVAVLQIISIWFFHNSLSQVIMISTIETAIMCVILFGILGRKWLKIYYH